MINQEVIVNQYLQEQVLYEDSDFPLARFIDQLDCFADGGFLCHWHTEFEFALVLKGSVEYLLDQQTFRLEQGMGIFINSKTLHSARQLEPGTITFNIAFPPALFNIMLSPSLYQKYFNPISMKNIRGCSFRDTGMEGTKILTALMKVHETASDTFAYELVCMEHLLQLWRNLQLLISQSRDDLSTCGDELREHRMHQMVDFIQKYMSSPLTVEEIAASASISRSECFRCFSLFGRTTPIEYLTKYRLQYASQQLIHTNDSISDICYACGFGSISYFGKVFHKAYGISPSAFRRKERAGRL